MSLTLPTPTDLYSLWGDEADDEDDDRATMLIQLSANLLWMAVGIEDDPTDPRLASMVNTAICDMAIHLFVSRDDINATYSPFQSERIGSYNYSKEYSRITRSVVWNEPTGVMFFDKVVAYLMDEYSYGDGLVLSGENVFKQGQLPLWIDSRVGSADIDFYVNPFRYGNFRG